MNQYKEGTVFQIRDGENEEYIVLKNMQIDGELYLVVAPISGEKDNLKLNSKKIVLLRVNSQTNEIEFEDDELIIRRVIDSLF